MKKKFGKFYKRRSQVYGKLRSRKLASGEYLVEHEPSHTEYYVFKRKEQEDWAIATRTEPQKMIAGFRKKDKAMEVLAKEGPRLIRVA